MVQKRSMVQRQVLGGRGWVVAVLLLGMLLEVFLQELDTDGITAVVEHLDELGPEPEQVRWVESLLRVDHPRATDLLQAIGRDHPRKAVAKAARTTAFKRLGLRLN